MNVQKYRKVLVGTPRFKSLKKIREEDRRQPCVPTHKYSMVRIDTREVQEGTSWVPTLNKVLSLHIEVQRGTIGTPKVHQVHKQVQRGAIRYSNCTDRR